MYPKGVPASQLFDDDGNIVGRIVNRTDTAAAIDSEVLLAGEAAWASDTNSFRIGDGITPGGFPIGGKTVTQPITGDGYTITHDGADTVVVTASYSTNNGTSLLRTASAAGIQAGTRIGQLLTINIQLTLTTTGTPATTTTTWGLTLTGTNVYSLLVPTIAFTGAVSASLFQIFARLRWDGTRWMPFALEGDALAGSTHSLKSVKYPLLMAGDYNTLPQGGYSILVGKGPTGGMYSMSLGESCGAARRSIAMGYRSVVGTGSSDTTTEFSFADGYAGYARVPTSRVMGQNFDFVTIGAAYQGHAQTHEASAYQKTTDATVTVLRYYNADGTTNKAFSQIFAQIDFATSNRCYLVEVYVSAFNRTDNKGAVFIRRAMVRHDSFSGYTITGDTEVYKQQDTGMTATAVAFQSASSPAIMVTGIAAKTIVWMAHVRVVEAG